MLNCSVFSDRPFPYQVDEDNDGCINFQEFLGLSMKLQSSLAENNLQTIFSEMDSDGDHFLTKSELQEGMSKFLGEFMDFVKNFLLL